MTLCSRSLCDLFLAVLPRCACAVVTAGLAFAATSTQAASGDWHKHNAVAASGTVDEADLDEVVFRGPRATVRGESGKVTLRYDVSLSGSTPNLDHFGCQGIWLYVRYRDNGDKARIVAKLKEYDVTSGDVTTLLVFDSNDFAQNGEFLRKNVSIQGANVHRVHNYNAYYVEVTITKNNAEGVADLAAVQVYFQEDF